MLYRIYSIKHRNAYKVFSVSIAVFIQGRHLFEGGVTFEITFLKSLTTVVVNCLCQKPVQIRVNVEKNVLFCRISLAMAKGLNHCTIMLKCFCIAFIFRSFVFFNTVVIFLGFGSKNIDLFPL